MVDEELCMAVRDQRDARPDVSAGGLERPIIIFDDPPGRSTRLAWLLGLGVLLLALIGAGAWLARDTGDDVVVRPAAEAPAVAKAAVASALAISVRAPAKVTVGQPARFVVSYTDGQGIFSGSIEDWGDVGVGSAKRAACGATTPAAGALQDSYVAAHRWAVAGSYPVSISVTTYTCSSGQATEETQKTQLTVVVAAK
jgi:hypothetical protein